MTTDTYGFTHADIGYWVTKNGANIKKVDTINDAVDEIEKLLFGEEATKDEGGSGA